MSCEANVKKKLQKIFLSTIHVKLFKLRLYLSNKDWENQMILSFCLSVITHYNTSISKYIDKISYIIDKKKTNNSVKNIIYDKFEGNLSKSFKFQKQSLFFALIYG